MSPVYSKRNAESGYAMEVVAMPVSHRAAQLQAAAAEVPENGLEAMLIDGCKVCVLHARGNFEERIENCIDVIENNIDFSRRDKKYFSAAHVLIDAVDKDALIRLLEHTPRYGRGWSAGTILPDNWNINEFHKSGS